MTHTHWRPFMKVESPPLRVTRLHAVKFLAWEQHGLKSFSRIPAVKPINCVDITNKWSDFVRDYLADIMDHSTQEAATLYIHCKSTTLHAPVGRFNQILSLGIHCDVHFNSCCTCIVGRYSSFIGVHLPYNNWKIGYWKFSVSTKRLCTAVTICAESLSYILGANRERVISSG